MRSAVAVVALMLTLGAAARAADDLPMPPRRKGNGKPLPPPKAAFPKKVDLVMTRVPGLKIAPPRPAPPPPLPPLAPVPLPPRHERNIADRKRCRTPGNHQAPHWLTCRQNHRMSHRALVPDRQSALESLELQSHRSFHLRMPGWLEIETVRPHRAEHFKEQRLVAILNRA